MKRVLLSLPGNEPIGSSLGSKLARDAGAIETGAFELRRFPDAETYVRIDTAVDRTSVILVCTLDRPDEKLLPLIFLAETARELGAREVGLVAPYLAYMRQDRSFNPGEGITSEYFARLLSSSIDWLVTVDPHLHRRSSLAELYAVPARVVHAADDLSDWIRANVDQPLIVGPDSESEQWASEVAGRAGAPYVVLEKKRRGDRDVEISMPDVGRWPSHTPVLVDDIVSTARTMIVTVRQLIQAGTRAPVCVAVHPVFADNAYDDLAAAGASRIVSCNTIVHASNGIDLTAILGDAVRMIIQATG